MPLTVIFVRHGESQANIDSVFANRPEIPGDLTGAGMAQSHTLARALKDMAITHVYTSPLPRAQQTAAIIASTLDVPCVSDPALCEYDVGDFEGLPYTGEHAWRWERYEQIEQAWRDGHIAARHPGGESLTHLRARFLPFMERLATTHSDTDIVVALGHGGLYRVMLPELLASTSPGPTLGHGDMVIAIHNGAEWHGQQWEHERSSASTADPRRPLR